MQHDDADGRIRFILFIIFCVCEYVCEELNEIAQMKFLNIVEVSIKKPIHLKRVP
jgi:hypothetical protein